MNLSKILKTEKIFMNVPIIDSTLFELVDITEIEEVPHLINMRDISVEDHESFTFADGIVSHNSAASQGTSVRDPKKHGFYALRGKVLNTHEMKSHEILANKELSELVAIIGLDFNDIHLTNEDGTTNLNYGRIGILTDADTDGNSIFCLLLMFFSRWPALFEQGRICRVNTPLYIARKKGKPDQYFYTTEEYEKTDLKGWTVDYLKGLGSLERDDYKKAVITHPYMSVISLDDMNKLNMAFGSDTNLRKKWMID